MNLSEDSGMKMWTCDWCGDEFETKHGLKTHVGMKHYRPTTTCITCETDFKRPPSHDGHPRCHECRNRSVKTEKQIEAIRKSWQDEELRREQSLRLGGNGELEESELYDDFTKKLKEQVRERDNHRCQICTIPEIALPRKLDVHHVERHDRIGCLISLCRQCHNKVSP